MQFANVSTRETMNENMVFCVFIPGSDAQGCAVELMGHIDNITVNLTRESGSREAVTLYELTLLLPPCPCLRYRGRWISW